MTSVQDRLKARWAKTGGGPELEERLKAAKAELARRDKVVKAKALGVTLPDKVAAPVVDPKTPERTGDGQADSSTPPPPISVEAVIEEARRKTIAEVEAAIKQGEAPAWARGVDSEDEDEEIKALEAGCREVTAYAAPKPTLPPDRLDPSHPLVRLKDEGNQSMRRGDFELAAQLYTQALHPGDKRKTTNDIDGVLYCNRSKARMQLDVPDLEGALADADAACKLCPDWPKPRARLAEANLALGFYRGAMIACRDGERCESRVNDHSKSFVPLMDRVAMRAAREGSLAGFDGRVIYVRSAGEEAWLGKEAPENAGFDVIDRDPFSNDTIDPSKHPDFAPGREVNRPIHARCLRDACEICEDGDRILILRGVHNGLGAACEIRKRVLIRGEGAFREAVIDARNNSPIFRIHRPCVIQNLDIDFTGFSEAVRVEGKPSNNPLIEHAWIACSGDFGVVVAGESAPTFRNCKIKGKRGGMRFMQDCAPDIVDCVVKDCEEGAGVYAYDRCTPHLRDCVIENNDHEGAVVMNRAVMTLTNCHVRDNRAPACEATHEGKFILDRCHVHENVGGIWLWEKGTCDVRATVVIEKTAPAVLCDPGADTKPKFGRGTIIHGFVMANDEALKKLTPARGVQWQKPEAAPSLPGEVGAFKFEYNMFTRKQ